MTTATDIKYIVLAPEVYGGKPCVEGHRIAVHDVAALHRQALSPDDIAEAFHLAPVQVYAALTYYYDHKDQTDREIEEEAEWMRAQAQADTSPQARRLRAAIAERRRQPPYA